MIHSKDSKLKKLIARKTRLLYRIRSLDKQITQLEEKNVKPTNRTGL